ncbi:hypothetical protein [Salinimonas iocasae]|uniref:SMODS-associating 2TM beta-strand rich effector domain-containing protein n=1 Tax=Salinimonas iocasae TaxID=2572577 RepID=A0A5B7YG82_9ALTE|nr:hypothetical protein [Salinimonas iocasae]QCZ94671.1 hypothetical protein FBQ74_14875 [Salinimonas iocasae]
MDYFETILLGVTAGVLTSLTLLFMKSVWVNSILPMYQAARYQGADVSGVWNSEYKNEEINSEASFSLDIRQRAHKLNGSLYFSYKSQEEKTSVNYNFEGEYWEGCLTLSCRNKDRKGFAQGALFLKVTHNGRRLEGTFSYRSSKTGDVVNNPIYMDRN